MAEAVYPRDLIVSQDALLQYHSAIPGTVAYEIPELYPFSHLEVTGEKMSNHIPKPL